MPKTAQTLCIVALSICLAGIAASQPPIPSPGEAAQQEQPQPSASQQSGAGNQQSPAPPPIIVHVPPPQKTEAEAAEERRERQEKAELDRRLVELTAELAHFTGGLYYATIIVAIATVFLVIATVGLGYFGWHQSRDMKESIAVSKKIGEAQVRAYLTITGGTYGIWGKDLRIEVEFENVGASPARNIAGQFYATTPLWDSARFPVRTHLCSDLAARGAGLIMGKLSSAENAERFFEYTSRNLGFRIEGIVAWDDVFGGRNEQPFKLNSRFDKTEDGIVSGRLDLEIIGEEATPKDPEGRA